MSGQMRPKRMSLQEAADYIATPEKWNPEDDARIDPAHVGPTVGDTDTYEPEPEPFYEDDESPEAVDAMAAQLSPAVHNPVDATTDELRPVEAIEADLAMLTSAEALLYTAEARHAATLRLLDDLIAARDAVNDLRRLISLVRPR